MNRLSVGFASLIVALPLVIAYSASCSQGGSGGGGGGVSSPAVDVTGQWTGAWVSSDGSSGGNLSISLIQNGSSVSGAATFSNTPCFSGGSVSGTCMGDNFSCAVTGNGTHIFFNTTMSGPANDVMTATYAVNSGGACTGEHGTASLNRQ